MEEALTREPWLREQDLCVDPALAQVLFSLQQVREDIAKYTKGLASVPALPLSFHLRHLAGSTDRLTTYLAGQPLDPSQLAELSQENTPGLTVQELLTALEISLQRAEAAIRDLNPNDFGEPRYIGRKRIRTTAIGLAIHIAEHAQRHTGQIITLCHGVNLP
jgi:hypothetical protein